MKLTRNLLSLACGLFLTFNSLPMAIAAESRREAALPADKAVYAWLNYPRSCLSGQQLTVRVTAYCPCPICCGKCDGITSTGIMAQANHTIAVDPGLIPLGTQVYLEGIGTFVAEDTGGVIQGNKIDLFMVDHQQALNFGVKNATAFILEQKI